MDQVLLLWHDDDRDHNCHNHHNHHHRHYSSPDQHHPQGESLPVSQSLPVQQELGATGIQHRKIHIINHPIGKLAKLFYTTSGCDGCDKYEVYWYSRSQESYPL